MTFLVEENENIRIDKYLASQDTGLSRSYIRKLFDEDRIRVNGRTVKPSYIVSEDEEIDFDVPELREPEIIAEDIALDILYEDDDVILINKPKGMVVHPAPGHYSGTVVNALMYHCGDSLSGINGVLRPGIVHRIDMNTTGVIVAAKNDKAHAVLSDQLKTHDITRKYKAIVKGVLKDDEGTITGNIGRSKNDRKKMALLQTGGREAVTHYKVLKRFRNHTYVECTLETGRTHQIRVHMSSIGYPVLGDDVYGSSSMEKSVCGIPLEGQCLHAAVLGFKHPNGEYMEFEAELPQYFATILNKLAT